MVLQVLKGNLNKLINSTGFSLKRVAEYADLPYTTLREINARDQTNPTIVTLVKLAICFNLTIEELVYSEVNPTNFIPDEKIPKPQIEDYLLAFNYKLVTLCDNTGLDLTELTKLTGLHRRTLENLLKRKDFTNTKPLKSMRLSTIALLAKAFSISVDELVGLKAGQLNSSYHKAGNFIADVVPKNSNIGLT